MSTEAAPAPLFGLETPLPLRPTQNYFQLIGWALLPGAETPTRVRMVVDRKTFEPVERIERSDVAATFPDERHSRNSGFKFICYLPFGFYIGFLEAATDGNEWVRICTLTIPVSAHPIRGAIEKPPGGSTITKPVRVEGWCFHPEFKVTEIVLQFGNVEMRCNYGVDRPDVAALFPNDPEARESGFISAENLPRGAGQVKIRARTECGRVFFVSSELDVDISEGWFANPPPPSPVRDLATLADFKPSIVDSTLSIPPTGDRNILFALYGDFTANSALHVANLANELIALGYDCVVAVPNQKETVGSLPHADFMAAEFGELNNLCAYFKDGGAPMLVHAWTTRENVRKFSESVRARYGSELFIHLEDNEQDILQTQLERPFAELRALPTTVLDALVPPALSHPHRALQFLESATGVTTIVESLRRFVPPEKPSTVIWPAADARLFTPRPRAEELRRALGFRNSDVVLFYHGNTHRSNAAEVRSLYEAVVRLNQHGTPTYLIRTGRDFAGFLPEGDGWIRPYLIHLGHIERAARLSSLMALADYFVQPGLPDAFNEYRFPSKLPEFFALGRPVVLPKTNLGNLLEHGRDAWILDRADDESIAAAISELHSDPRLVDKLSEGALAFAEKHFSWKRSSKKLVEFYRSLTPLAPPASS